MVLKNKAEMPNLGTSPSGTQDRKKDFAEITQIASAKWKPMIAKEKEEFRYEAEREAKDGIPPEFGSTR